MKRYYNLGERTPCGRLPKNVSFTVKASVWDAECDPAEEYLTDAVTDRLSDAYGFCVAGIGEVYRCAVLDDSENDSDNDSENDSDSIRIFITDIRWDTKD